MTRVQNQWAPEGLAGSSVSRLIATRIFVVSERARGDGGRGHPRLPDVLREKVHARLMCVLDDPIVVRVDMHRDRREFAGGATREAGQGNGVQEVLVGPL